MRWALSLVVVYRPVVARVDDRGMDDCGAMARMESTEHAMGDAQCLSRSIYSSLDVEMAGRWKTSRGAEREMPDREEEKGAGGETRWPRPSKVREEERKRERTMTKKRQQRIKGGDKGQCQVGHSLEVKRDGKEEER